MDRELTGCVDDAVAIAASGRWAAINERIVHFAGTAAGGRYWHFPLFSSLYFRVFNEYLALKKAYYAPSTDDLSLIAWRARDLRRSVSKGASSHMLMGLTSEFLARAEAERIFNQREK
jgi:hypothetical protein